MQRPTRQCTTAALHRIKQIHAWENLHEGSEELQRVADMIQTEFENEEQAGIIHACDIDDDIDDDAEDIDIEDIDDADAANTKQMGDGSGKEDRASSGEGGDNDKTPGKTEGSTGGRRDSQEQEAMDDESDSASDSASDSEAHDPSCDSEEYESSFVTSDSDACSDEEDWQPPPK